MNQELDIIKLQVQFINQKMYKVMEMLINNLYMTSKILQTFYQLTTNSLYLINK